MDYLPAFIDVVDQPCLLIGGGEAAANKARLLLRAKAAVTVLAPSLNATLSRLASAQKITHRPVAFTPRDLKGQRLVISAAEDESVNQAVAAAAREAGVLVNVVDRPELCSFVVPALVDREPVLVAISTGGTAPVLGRMVRARVESLLPPGFGRLAAFATAFREQVRQAITDSARRRKFWEHLFEGEVAELVYAGRDGEAREAVLEAIATGQREATPSGEICLVDVRVDAPDLLTLGALRVMQCADVVLHDRTISTAVLDLTRRDARRIAVEDTSTESAADRKCLSLAEQGERVLRLVDGYREDAVVTTRRLESASGERFSIRLFPGP